MKADERIGLPSFTLMFSALPFSVIPFISSFSHLVWKPLQQPRELILALIFRWSSHADGLSLMRDHIRDTDAYKSSCWHPTEDGERNRLD